VPSISPLQEYTKEQQFSSSAMSNRQEGEQYKTPGTRNFWGIFLDQEHIYGFLFELACSAQEYGQVLTQGRQAETQQHHACLAVPATKLLAVKLAVLLETSRNVAAPRMSGRAGDALSR
jgi:hypothetical protein